MQYLAGYGFAATVISVITILILRHFRSQHDSGLESCFETNRIRARLYIEIYQKWMVAVFATTLISLAVFVIGLVWLWRNGYFVTCQ